MKTDFLLMEEAISFTKQVFESELKKRLELTKVSAPIAILSGTGINDDLNGIEKTVLFPIKALPNKEAVIVNSLAKWKRIRLRELAVDAGKGIVTDMRAIRPDEDYSPIHSIYVDQWDWEKHMPSASRSIAYLKQEVLKIYEALKETEVTIANEHGHIVPILPEKITFIHSEDLLQQHPTLTPKEREAAITKEYGAVFLIGIGGKLSNGEIHDGRAPDYDDWSTENDAGYFGLNGDILLWNPVLNDSFEVSSMGIRVDKTALEYQLKATGHENRKSLHFHQMLLNEEIPQSIGGGIGQSRVCMFMLRKKHIGEVQVGIWEDEVRAKLREEDIYLL